MQQNLSHMHFWFWNFNNDPVIVNSTRVRTESSTSSSCERRLIFFRLVRLHWSRRPAGLPLSWLIMVSPPQCTFYLRAAPPIGRPCRRYGVPLDARQNCQGKNRRTTATNFDETWSGISLPGWGGCNITYNPQKWKILHKFALRNHYLHFHDWYNVFRTREH